jgi:peroxiredoxin
VTVTQEAGRAGPQPPISARRSERIWIVVATVAVLFLIGFIVFVATRPHGPRAVAYPVSPPAQLAVGSTAPAFDLPRLGGGAPVTLADTRGTPTVVNFFASWCKDCQAELSAFGAFSAQVGAKTAIIGVDSNDSNPTEALALLARAGASYPVGVDSQAKVATSFLIVALPVTYFLDRQGRVAHVAFGAQSQASLDHWASEIDRPAR